MPYNFHADSIHTKKLCGMLSSSKVQFYTEKAVLRFWASLRGIRVTYGAPLGLIGKRVVDFLLVLTDFFR